MTPSPSILARAAARLRRDAAILLGVGERKCIPEVVEESRECLSLAEEVERLTERKERR